MTSPTTTTLPPHLQSDREIHVIVSILSGHHAAQEHYNTELKPLLDSYSVRYNKHTTNSAKTITELTRSLFLPNARKGVKQTIILLSGDGGLVDIVDTLSTTLMRSNDDAQTSSIFIAPVVVLVPMGTANAMAWSAGVAADPLKVLIHGRASTLPTFEVRMSSGAMLVTCEGHGREGVGSTDTEGRCVMFGAVVFSWGLHASLVARSDTTEYRKHGRDRFKMAAEELLKQSHHYRGQVRIQKGSEEWEDLKYPGVEESKEHAYVLATLVSNLEEHFRISPATEPLDGRMRLLAFGPLPSNETMRLLGLAYQGGKHVEERNLLRYEEVDAVRIMFHEVDEEWREICIDGKIVAIEEGGWAEVRIARGHRVDGRGIVELVC